MIHQAEQLFAVFNDLGDKRQAVLFAGMLDEQGFATLELEPIQDNDWPAALKLIEDKGFEACKRAFQGDFFWHPQCAPCDRCRRHRPECGYDKRIGKDNLICVRCSS